VSQRRQEDKKTWRQGDKETRRQDECCGQRWHQQQIYCLVFPSPRLPVFTAYAIVDANPTRYQTLIRALNGNIDYLRKHAMAKGSSGDEPEPTPDGGGSDVTPVVPEA